MTHQAVRTAGVTRVRGLIPHAFSPRVEFIGASTMPRVLFSREVYTKMWTMIDLSEMEVGWMGLVQRDGFDFIIEDVFLVRQEVSSSTTIITEEGLAELVMEMLGEGDDAAIEKTQRLHFWGHSHVNIETLPSPQDERQTMKFLESGIPVFIRGIFNKKGSARFDIYMVESGLKIADAPWMLIEPEDTALRDRIAAELSDKVSKHQPPKRRVYSSEDDKVTYLGSNRATQGTNQSSDSIPYGWERRFSYVTGDFIYNNANLNLPQVAKYQRNRRFENGMQVSPDRNTGDLPLIYQLLSEVLEESSMLNEYSDEDLVLMFNQLHEAGALSYQLRRQAWMQSQVIDVQEIELPEESSVIPPITPVIGTSYPTFLEEGERDGTSNSGG